MWPRIIDLNTPMPVAQTAGEKINTAHEEDALDIRNPMTLTRSTRWLRPSIQFRRTIREFAFLGLHVNRYGRIQWHDFRCLIWMRRVRISYNDGLATS
jgi:hypothetical protein